MFIEVDNYELIQTIENAHDNYISGFLVIKISTLKIKP